MEKYKTYEKYKPSGVEWLGEIPEHWEVRRLKSAISSVINGVWGNEPQDDENDFVCIRVADFNYDLLSISSEKLTVRNIERSQLSSRRLDKDDLLVEKSGGGENQTVGRVVSYNLSLSAVCSNFIARLTTSDCINNRFLCYVFSALYSGGLNTCSIKQTTGIQNLDLSSYLCERFSFPPIAEQKSIARFLDRETTRIDTLITKKRQLIALLQKKRFSAIIHAVTKGLDSQVDMKNANVFWLEEVPKHWGLCQLKFACVLQRGFDLPSQERQEGEFPIYGGGGITGYHEQAMVSPPGVVTGRYGTIGEVHFVEEPFWPLNTSLYVKEFWENSPKFIHYLLSALHIDIYSGKSAVPGVDRNDLHAIPVPIPSKEEQDEIVHYLEKIDTYQSKLTQMVEDQLKEVEKYRSALITAAVTGKIDVREEVN